MKREVFLIGLFILFLEISSLSCFAANETHYLISDTNRQRIVEVNQNGTLIWSENCDGPSCFCKGANCFYGFDSAQRLTNGNTLFIDNMKNKIVEINVNGDIIWKYGEGTIGYYTNQVNHPQGVFRTKSGSTLIADTGNNRVIEVGSANAISWEYGCSNKYVDCSDNVLNENLKDPNSAVETDSGTIVISDTNNNRVLEVDKSKGVLFGFGCTAFDVFKTCPIDERSLYKPMYAERNKDLILIADSGNDRIIDVNRSGEIAWTYGVRKGSGENELNYPKAAKKLSNGNILITDTGNNRIIEVNYSTKKIVFEYRGLNAPSFAVVPEINYKKVRTRSPGCIQKKTGFEFSFETSVMPKFSYVQKKGSDKKIYLLGNYTGTKFVSIPEKVTESGAYEFTAVYDDQTEKYDAYCNLGSLICNAINLTINSCKIKNGILNVTFSGLNENARFINFNNMYFDIYSDEKIWSESKKITCDKPKLDLSRLAIGTYAKKVGLDSYSVISPLGKYSVKSIKLSLQECCEEKNESTEFKPNVFAEVKCEIIKECKEDYECDDGNKYTLDLCERGYCMNIRKNITCFADEDCDDRNKCTEDLCSGGMCQNVQKCVGCNYCNPKIGCVTNETCLNDLEQKDNNQSAIMQNEEKINDSSSKIKNKSSFIMGAELFGIILAIVIIVLIFFGRKIYLILKKTKEETKLLVSSMSEELRKKREVTEKLTEEAKKNAEVNIVNPIFQKNSPDYQSFKMKNGHHLRNLDELLTELKFMTKEEFSEHVNVDNSFGVKNDFADWVKNSLGLGQLSDQIRVMITREELIKLLEEEKIKKPVSGLTQEKKK